MSSMSRAFELLTRASISPRALRASAPLTARDRREPEVDNSTAPPKPFESDAPIALSMCDFPVPGTPYRNSGLYMVPGEVTTDIAAACAQRLYAPTSKVSKVQFGRRSTASGYSVSPAGGATESIMGDGAAVGCGGGAAA